MQKITFVSIILLIGLFSLQMGTKTTVDDYYGKPEQAELIVQEAVHLDTTELLERYEITQDSSGNYTLKEKVNTIPL
jgi:hypothetical protein